MNKFDSNKFYLVVRGNAADALRGKYLNQESSERDIRNFVIPALMDDNVEVIHSIEQDRGLLVVHRCYFRTLQRYMDVSVVLSMKKAPDNKLGLAFLTMIRTPEESDQNREAARGASSKDSQEKQKRLAERHSRKMNRRRAHIVNRMRKIRNEDANQDDLEDLE